MTGAVQFQRSRGGQMVDAAAPAVLRAAAIAARDLGSAPLLWARLSRSSSSWNNWSCTPSGDAGSSVVRSANSSRKKGQDTLGASSAMAAVPVINVFKRYYKLKIGIYAITRVGFWPEYLFFLRKLYDFAPVKHFRSDFQDRAGFCRLVGSVVTVSDVGGPVPHSRRSRGASEVRRCPAADAPVMGVPPKDLAAPVPAGAALFSGQSYSRACLRRQAVGRRAPACVPASSSHLPHPTRSVASIFLKHGGLTECGQSRGVAAQ